MGWRSRDDSWPDELDESWFPRDHGESDSRDGPDSDSGILDPDRAECWRCGGVASSDLQRCPHCGARWELEEPEDNPFRLPRSGKKARQAFLHIVGLYAVMMGVTIVAVAIQIVLHFKSGRTEEEARRSTMLVLVTVEAILTALTILGVCLIRVPSLAPRPRAERFVAWVWGLPVLAFLLGINAAYHLALRRLVGVPDEASGLEKDVWTFLLICVQPAVVEELFFRYLTLGALARLNGLHGAVWISAVMFGAAHLGAILSLPILILIGAGLGYLRVASGGLALPMLLHGIHNAVILFYS
jgi:membrane protease YdiL (CAAX protease family)